MNALEAQKGIRQEGGSRGDANQRQVGGQHYASEYQHWDLCEDGGIGYLESAASKYMTRWEKKNGVQDVEKAIHYTDKLIDRINHHNRSPRGKNNNDDLERFFQANNLYTPTRGARQVVLRAVRFSIVGMHTWRTVFDVIKAKENMEEALQLIQSGIVGTKA